MYQYIRLGWIIGTLAIALFQLVISPTPTNLSCVLVAIVTNILAGQYLFRERSFRTFAFSSLQILVFVLANFSLPLIFTTLEGHPITYNLSVPGLTFGWCAAMTLTMIFSHWIYTMSSPIQRLRGTLIKKVNLRIGLFHTPSELQFWLMGFAGLAVMFYVYLFLRDVGEITNDANVKFLQAFQGFAYAPYLLVLRFLFSDPASKESTKVSPRQIMFLVAYSGLILLLSVGRNSRSTFSLPILIMIMGATLGLLTNRLSSKVVKVQVVLPIIVAAIIIFPFLTRLSNAMLAARRYRSSVSSAELVQISLDVLSNQSDDDSDALSPNLRGDSSWNEVYVASPLLSRFISVKFHDNILYLTNETSDSFRSDLASDTASRIMALLPAPILSAFGIALEKEEVLRGSSGDYIYFLRYGRGLGGFKAGSYIGPASVILRGLFLPAFGLISILAFILVDSLTALRRTRDASGRNLVVPYFAPLGLMQIFLFARFFLSDDISSLISFFVRGYPQIIVLYLILFYGTRMLSLIWDRVPDQTPAD